jgi:hypothetical protein
MAGNVSLTRFRNQTTFWAITAVVAFVIGWIVLGTNGHNKVTDTDGYSYASYSECLDANYMDSSSDDGTTCTEDPTQRIVDPNLAMLGYSFLGIGGLAFNFAIVGRFLIMTTDSLLEGLGGNLHSVVAPGKPQHKEYS